MRFGPSFDGSGFAPEGAEVEALGGADFDELAVAPAAFERCASQYAEGALRGEHKIEDTLEAQLPGGQARFGGRLLHDGAQEVEGDHHHEHALFSHCRGTHLKELQAERGLQVAQLELNLPTPGIEFGQRQVFVFIGIQQRGCQDEIAQLPGAVFKAHLNETHFHRLGQGVPLRLAEVAGLWELVRLAPRDPPGKAAELPAPAPVELPVPGVMQAHEHVAASLSDLRYQLVRTEGAIPQEQVAFTHMIDQPVGHAGLVLAEVGALDGFPAVVTEVEQAGDAHDREAAARLLGGRLRIGLLVGFRVHQLERTAVDGLQLEAPPEVFFSPSAPQRVEHAPVDVLEEIFAHPAASLTVAAGVALRHGQAGFLVPALQEPQGLQAGSIAFQNLGEPGPEDRHVTEAALAFGGIDGGQELRGQDFAEEHGVAAQGIPDHAGPEPSGADLQAALGGGNNGGRKVG